MNGVVLRMVTPIDHSRARLRALVGARKQE